MLLTVNMKLCDIHRTNFCLSVATVVMRTRLTDGICVLYIACLVIFTDMPRPALSIGLQPQVYGPMHFCGLNCSQFIYRLAYGRCLQKRLHVLWTLPVPNQTSASFSHETSAGQYAALEDSICRCRSPECFR
jgi:hypothetical protein